MSEVIKDVSLALSGAGFKFVAHLGALKAIENDHREVKEIAGVSGGAIVAGLYSCGLSVDSMTRVMLTKDWRPYYQYNPLNLMSCEIGKSSTIVVELLSPSNLVKNTVLVSRIKLIVGTVKPALYLETPLLILNSST